MAPTIPTFLELPFELRLQIYEIALDKRLGFQPKTYLCISAVCRQIRAEVLPVVFQDARYLRSLSHLSDWTLKGSRNLLKHVQNISLHVFMESLSSMTRFRPTCQIAENHAQPQTAEWWEAKYAEQFKPPGAPLAQLFSFIEAAMSKMSNAFGFPTKGRLDNNPICSTWNALTSIGELKKIWIVLKDETGAEYPKYDIEQQLVLNMVAAACPKMQEFTGFSNLLPLDYLQNFHDLRLLRFSGYSKSTAEETLGILRGFNKLDSIIVYRYPEHYDKDYAIFTSKLPLHLSFTPDVLSKVRPLKRFEISHMTSRVPSQHITVPILRALRDHKESLRTLSLHSDLPVDGEYLQELLNFINSSDLSNLSLQFTIPKKLESLMSSDAIFPKNTRHHERTFSKSHQSVAGRDFVRLFLRASQ